MKYNTYVINLKKDIERYNNLSKLLKNVNIDFTRFDAIDGKNVLNEYDKHINLKFKHFIPKSVLGCMLSHAVLSEYIYKNDENDYALILEDDIIPNFKDKRIIDKEISKAPKDWDIILLFCQGLCDYNKNTNKLGDNNGGSTAAYIINKKGLYKQSTYKYSSHVDMQRKLLKLNIYKTKKPIFLIDKNFESNNKTNSINLLTKIKVPFTNNFSLDDLVYYKMVRIPIIYYELNLLQYLFISIFTTLIFYFVSKDIKKSVIFFCLFYVFLYCIVYNAL